MIDHDRSAAADDRDRDHPEIVCYRRSTDRTTNANADGWMFRGEAVHQWLFAPAHACIELPEAR
jgi:hypothetical protein